MRPMQRSVTAALFAVTALSAGACTNSDARDPAAPGPELLTVSLAPTLDTLATGASLQFTARVFDTQNQPRLSTLSWKSADPAVASVSAGGLVTAVAPGRTEISVSAGGTSATATIVVVPVVTSLSLSPGAMSVVVGDSLLLTASAQRGEGVAASVTGIRWMVSDPTIAVVSADGVVSGVAAGDAIISAELLGTTATAAVQVVKNSVASVTVAPANSSIYPTETQQLTAALLDAQGRPVTSQSLKWTSSDPAVATVSGNGLVTGVAKGTAVITAQAQGKRATATVNVFAVPVATVTVSLNTNTLAVGQSTQATATLTDAEGNALSGRIVAWQSSNPALATVASSGLVTAVANGAVTISAISEGKLGNASLTIDTPVAASIVIAPSSVEVVAGQSAQLAAEIHDAKGSAIPNRTIRWSTGDGAIATITQTGVVSGLALGSTTVIASADGLTTSVPVSVSAVKAASVSLSPAAIPLVVGGTSQLTATVKDATGAPLADRVVAWSSSDPAIVRVSSTGVVTAVGAGSAAIMARIDDVSASSAATVTLPTPEPVVAISVGLSASTMKIGETTQATATLRDASGNVLTDRLVVWSSANPEVATVSSLGLVTAIAPGSASIVAASEGETGAGTVTIVAPPPAPVATVALSASSTSLFVGESTQLGVTLEDSAGNVLIGRTIGYTSSNTSLATVSPGGLVTAVGVGTATITAVSESKSGSIAISIAAVPVADVVVAPASLSLAAGQTAQLVATVRDGAGNVLTGRAVAWSSSDAAVASVSAAGLVTARAAGAATVTAASEGKTGAAAVAVAAAPPPASCALVTDRGARATSPLARPGYLAPVAEPDFGTTLVRVGGDPGAPIPGLGGPVWGQISRHRYSKDPVWSADGKMAVLKHLGGAAGPGVQLYIDGETYRPIVARSHPGPEARWHPTLPDVMIYVTSQGGVGHWNPRTGAAAAKFAVAGYGSAAMGPYEGNPSADGRYVAVNATRSGDGRPVVYVVDLELGRKSADVDVLAQGFGSAADLDWASVSQGGRYLVLHGRIGGVYRLTKVYDRATLAPVAFWQDHPLGHFDLGIDAWGNEVAFGAAAGGPYAKRFVMRRLDNGAVTPLTEAVSYDWHASTRNVRRPGWGYAVTNGATGSVFDRTVYAVRLDGSGAVERYAHHRTNHTDYDASPFAAPSPDGRRVMFASNWGAATGRPVQSYVIDTRPICP